MFLQPRFRRLVLMLVPVAITAGCLRTGALGYEDQPLVDLGAPAAEVVPDADLRRAPVRRPPASDLTPPSPLPQRPRGVEGEAGRSARDPAHAVADGVTERPVWLGTVPLPPAPDDGSFLPTPPELVDRRLPPPPSDLPAPASEDYAAEVAPVPDDVLRRSTWSPACPVSPTDLRYVRVVHWGFDGRIHTGELIVHRAAAEQMAWVFQRLHELRYPIEELRVLSADDLNAVSSGDGNVSSAFVCRRSTGSGRWSDHAYGTAIDLNPFHNPYIRGSLVIPGLAGAYADRDDHRDGMIMIADEVIETFSAIGWRWGGDWRSSKDYMHFSASGR